MLGNGQGSSRHAGNAKLNNNSLSRDILNECVSTSEGYKRGLIFYARAPCLHDALRNQFFFYWCYFFFYPCFRQNERVIAIYFIVFEGKMCSSASARECFFPKQTMKYVALNARLSPFKKPFLYFFCCF